MKEQNCGEVYHRSLRLRQTIIVLAAFGVAFSCRAEDAHNYDSYIRLKNDLYIAENVAGCPPADAWNPEGEMKDGSYYLIPEGITLTHLTQKTEGMPTGGRWPGEELAVAGVFHVGAKNGRDNAAETPHLALLAGGRLLLSTAFGTIKGGTIDVRGTVGNPALIEYDFASINDKSTYYPLLDVAFTGGEDAVVEFRYTAIGENFDVFQRAFRVTGGFAGYKGMVAVEGEKTWLRPQTGSKTFDIGGMLRIANRGNVYVSEVSPVFGSLMIDAGSKLRIAAGLTVTVAGALHLMPGAKIAVDAIAGKEFAYDNGSNVPPEVPVLSVSGAENAEKVDRSALLAAIAAGGVAFENSETQAGLPRFRLVENLRDDGGVDFKVSYVPVVEQTASCSRDSSTYAHEAMHETHLGDKKPVSPDKDYYNTEWHVFFTSKDVQEYTFPGGSLTARFLKNGRVIGFYGDDKVLIPDFRIIGEAGYDSRIRHMTANGTCYLKGGLTLSGIVNFSMSGSGIFHLESSLRGTGDLVETLDMAKIIEKNGKCQGTLSLEGDNAEFKGRILVGCGLEPIKDSLDLTNLTLQVSSGANLGGPCEEFVFDAVKIAKFCKLSITDTSTFDAGNRGWCLMDGSSVEVAPDKVATVKGTVTFGGASEKTGTGTLVLGGSAKFYDSQNDCAVNVPNGAEFRVAAGRLGVTSSSALTGVNLKFAHGAKLVVMPESECMTLSSSPVIEGDNLSVEVELPEDADRMAVDILSLPASASFDSSRFSLPRKPGYAIVLATWQENGNAIYTISCEKIGFIITVR